MAKLVTLNNRMTPRLCRRLGIPFSAAGRKLLPRMARRLGLRIQPGDFVEVEVDDGDGPADPFIASRSGDVPRIEVTLRLTGKTLARVRRTLGLADDASSDEVGAAIVDHFSADDTADVGNDVGSGNRVGRGGRNIGTLGGPPRHGSSPSAARAAAAMMSRANLKRFLFARAKKAERRGGDADELSAIRAETEIWARRHQSGGGVTGPTPEETTAANAELVDKLVVDNGMSQSEAEAFLQKQTGKTPRREQHEQQSQPFGLLDLSNPLGLTPLARMAGVTGTSK